MINKKLLLSKILHHSRLITFAKQHSNSKLLVCNYHRVYENQLDTRFDEGVFAHSISDFEKHVIWLKENTDIISEEDLISILKNRISVPKFCSLITFDDGYIDNYNLAYPVLKRLCVPAIYFIPSYQITSRQLGWWDIIAYLIKSSKQPSIPVNNGIISLTDRSNAIHTYHNIMKTTPSKETVNVLSNLSEWCDVQLPDSESQSKELMTWDQIRAISQDGITIGSHTHSHRVLSTISAEEQKEEMITSSIIIEREIGKKVRTIAYPVGNYEHFTIETMLLASDSGYEAAFSFNTGINYINNLSQFDIKRIEPPADIELLSAMTFLPNLFI